VKVAFDEHVPIGMVKVFQGLSQDRRFRLHKLSFVKARDYAPAKRDRDYVARSDVPWLERFTGDGGRAIISGNVEMLDNPFEMSALQSLGLVTIMFPGKWSQWDAYRKSSLVLFHFEKIIAKIKLAKRDKFWLVPARFSEEAKLRNVSPGRKKLVRRRPQRAKPPVTKADGPRRIPTKKDPAQAEWDF
jgi:hypothetical protein